MVIWLGIGVNRLRRRGRGGAAPPGAVGGEEGGGEAGARHLGRRVGVGVSGEAVGLALRKVLASAVDDVAVRGVEVHGADLVVPYQAGEGGVGPGVDARA